MLRCSNEDCESRRDEQEPFFDICVSVNRDRCIAETLNKHYVDARFFKCCYCGDPAEETDDTKGAA